MALKKKALASIFSMNTRGFENPPFFLNSTLRCGEILLVFFVVSQRREREREKVRPLPGDCPYHRFFLYPTCFLSLHRRLASSILSLFFERKRDGRRRRGSGQEESVSTCGEIIIAYVTPYRNT